MRRRTFLAASLGSAGAICFGGCSDGDDSASPRTTAANGEDPGLVPAPRPTIRLAGGDFGFPSPFGYSRGPGYIQMSYVYDTLLWKDASGELLPWLATGYQRSDDGRTYTFDLRDGVRWHDGMPLTAEDVAFTFQYFAEQDLSPAVIVQPVPDITEVVALDEGTVEFRLANPVATFLQFGGAGAVPIVPKHIWSTVDRAAAATQPEVLVGSGPYRLESYTAGEGSYLFTAYDDYFLGRPFVERIEHIPVGDELTALMAGEIDEAGVSGVRPEALEPFRRDDGFEVLEAPPGVSQEGLYWNLDRGGALADVTFRHACARAINREELVERLFGGNGTPGNPGWIPPENPFYNQAVDQYPFDPAAANKMLDDAGYTRENLEDVRRGPDGQPLQFGLLVTAPPSPAIDLVVRYLRAVGVELTPEAADRPTFNERVTTGDFEMAIIGSGGMNSDLAPDYLRLVYASYTDLTQHAEGYKNPEVDRLCQEQLETLDVQERMEIVAEIQELVAADLPLLPLFYPGSFSVFRPSAFDEWYYTPGGVAGVVPTVQNKQVFVTGVPNGVEVRPIAG